MRLIGSIHPLAILLYGLAVLAVAGIVHIVTVFEAPTRAPHDAFARLAAVTPLNSFARLQPAVGGDNGIPFRDPAMLTAACRFDLSTGPVRITAEPIDRGFIAVGMHSRRGVVFYGLNIRSSERSPITMVLLTAAQKAAAEAEDTGDEPVSDLRVLAREPQGFVLVETPVEENGASTLAQEALDRVHCGAVAASGSALKR